jgi:hypothetical protein
VLNIRDKFRATQNLEEEKTNKRLLNLFRKTVATFIVVLCPSHNSHGTGACSSSVDPSLDLSKMLESSTIDQQQWILSWTIL